MKVVSRMNGFGLLVRRAWKPTVVFFLYTRFSNWFGCLLRRLGASGIIRSLKRDYLELMLSKPWLFRIFFGLKHLNPSHLILNTLGHPHFIFTPNCDFHIFNCGGSLSYGTFFFPSSIFFPLQNGIMVPPPAPQGGICQQQTIRLF